VLIAAAALLSLAGCGHRTQVTAARAERRDLVIPVLCDGVLEPGAGGEVRASEPATIASLPVRDGSHVTAGQLLLTLSNPDLSEKARGSRSEVEALSADLEAARSDVAALTEEAGRRRRTLESDDRLLKAGAITRETRDADAAALSDAEARLRGAEAKVKSLVRDGQESRLALAERSASDLEREAGALTVRSPAAGIVYGLPRRVGMRVETGDVLAAIADPSARRVRIRIDEPDLPRVAVGQKLTVTFDGLPGRRWDGQIVEVAAGLREEGGRHVGDVSGEIVDREALLPGNASVNVSIVTAQRPGALVIPRAAIFRDGARRLVFVLESGKARQRVVSIGLLGPTEAEVTGGLRDGDRVILPGAVPLKDGVPVSASEN
jgi:HlyD family secretion protein